MPDCIFEDDLAGEPVGGLPNYWIVRQQYLSDAALRTTYYIRIATRDGEQVVEARVPKVYEMGRVEGPTFEQAWWVEARMCGRSSLTPHTGAPNLGLGGWTEEHVRLGLCQWGNLTAVTAQGQVAGESFKEPLLFVPLSTYSEMHTYSLRLIPTLEFWFDGQLLGSRPSGAWLLGGPIRIDAASDQWGEPAVNEAGLCFTGVRLEGAQPHAAGTLEIPQDNGPLEYQLETCHAWNDYRYGRPEGWRTIVRTKVVNQWQKEAEISGATHVNLLWTGDGRLRAVRFRPADKTIYTGLLTGGAPMLQEHYYPSVLSMPQAGLALLVCYKEAGLYAFQGRQTSAGSVAWETDTPFVVTEGNAFPQRAALRQSADGTIVALFLDREKQLQERTSTDFGKTWA